MVRFIVVTVFGRYGQRLRTREGRKNSGRVQVLVAIRNGQGHSILVSVCVCVYACVLLPTVLMEMEFI